MTKEVGIGFGIFFFWVLGFANSQWLAERDPSAVYMLLARLLRTVCIIAQCLPKRERAEYLSADYLRERIRGGRVRQCGVALNFHHPISASNLRGAHIVHL